MDSQGRRQAPAGSVRRVVRPRPRARRVPRGHPDVHVPRAPQQADKRSGATRGSGDRRRAPLRALPERLPVRAARGRRGAESRRPRLLRNGPQAPRLVHYPLRIRLDGAGAYAVPQRPDHRPRSAEQPVRESDSRDRSRPNAGQDAQRDVLHSGGRGARNVQGRADDGGQEPCAGGLVGRRSADAVRRRRRARAQYDGAAEKPPARTDRGLDCIRPRRRVGRVPANVRVRHSDRAGEAGKGRRRRTLDPRHHRQADFRAGRQPDGGSDNALETVHRHHRRREGRSIAAAAPQSGGEDSVRGHARHRSESGLAPRRHGRTAGRRQVCRGGARGARLHIRQMGGRARRDGEGAPSRGRRAGAGAAQERAALRHLQPGDRDFRQPSAARTRRAARADRPAPAVLSGRLARVRHSDRQPALRANRRRTGHGGQKAGSRPTGTRGIRDGQMQRPVRAHSRSRAEPSQTRRRDSDVHRPIEYLLRTEQEAPARAVRAQQRRAAAAESGQRPVGIPREPGVQPDESPANDHPDRRDLDAKRRSRHSGDRNEQVGQGRAPPFLGVEGVRSVPHPPQDAGRAP